MHKPISVHLPRPVPWLAMPILNNDLGGRAVNTPPCHSLSYASTFTHKPRSVHPHPPVCWLPVPMPGNHLGGHVVRSAAHGERAAVSQALGKAEVSNLSAERSGWRGVGGGRGGVERGRHASGIKSIEKVGGWGRGSNPHCKKQSASSSYCQLVNGCSRKKLTHHRVHEARFIKSNCCDRCTPCASRQCQCHALPLTRTHNNHSLPLTTQPHTHVKQRPGTQSSEAQPLSFKARI